MLERSTGSVTVIYLDREAVIEKTRAAVDALAHQHAEIVRVVLFGSMARGDAVPGSDVDLLMVLSESRFRSWTGPSSTSRRASRLRWTCLRTPRTRLRR